MLLDEVSEVAGVKIHQIIEESLILEIVVESQSVSCTRQHPHDISLPKYSIYLVIINDMDLIDFLNSK